MKQIVTVILILLLTVSFIGCATIIDGRYQVVTINSNVEGATVSLGAHVIGVTPFVGSLHRSENARRLTISKEGYYTQTIVLTVRPNPLIYWNFFNLILPGMIVDNQSGAGSEYSPSVIYVHLRKIEPMYTGE